MNTEPVIINQVESLYAQQLRDWDLARDKYAAVANARHRLLRDDACRDGLGEMCLQFNPERVKSSGAKIDKVSLAARPCFLCPQHQPMEQKGFLWHERYKIQINPYPIFTRHLTISTVEHTPQLIGGREDDMLALAEALPEYLVFYNGPQCGASAPDHMHFQAAKGVFPLCEALKSHFRNKALDNEWLVDETEVDLALGRSFIAFSSCSRNACREWLQRLPKRGILPRYTCDNEARANVLCFCTDMATTQRQYFVIVFPRPKHRPSNYGDAQDAFLISPASVDMVGFITIPRQEDFERITLEDIKQMLREVTGFTHEVHSRMNNT